MKGMLKLALCASLMTFQTSLLTSCSDWFDVRPKSQVKEGDLFSTESGFRDATLGVYTLMATTEAYGGNMTMGLVDVLAQQYSELKAPYAAAGSYSYSDKNIETMIDDMWCQSYKVIANCNYLLKNCEENASIVNPTTLRIIKGEALAARAYAHFDMLRLYAPSYAAGKDAPGVPLVTAPTVEVQPLLSVGEICDRLVADLETARALLAEVDPILKGNYSENVSYSVEDYLEDEGFMLYRTSRFNYYAVEALLARISLYKGDKANALKYAKDVIESGKFQFVNDNIIAADQNDFAAANNSHYSFMQSVAKHEYISSLYIYNLKENCSDQYFRDLQSAELRSSDQRKQEVFGTNGIDFDIRSKRMFYVPNGSSHEYVCKYASGTQIPLLKIGEMYLIAAEASGDINYLYTMLQSRGYATPQSEGTDLKQLLQKEYQREFVAEGQLFYFYKRNNLSRIPFSAQDATSAIYVLPKPLEEQEFGAK